ncbi:unnamed protein product [Cylindrotheca closterium]|uniref:Uncharacterized protein n=1 Tax=Cylindrotheca closterium TaxID=2856 RepID=A0AAD2CYE3_9STRA|nr:unnamed protein product [Cylindrotheca closterium]
MTRKTERFFLHFLYSAALVVSVSSFVHPPQFQLTVSLQSGRLSFSSPASSLSLQKGWFAPDDDEDEPVTREQFQRDLLEDPIVRRKKKNGRYKPLDNRDHLPFAVKKVTPDPYTHPEIKKDKRKTTKAKKSDLDHHMTSSRLFTENDSGDTTLLGEFKLDKSTTSGDKIMIGEREYQVQTARCQYRYAGGKRFVMVRKILEVKEVARVEKEEFLKQQFEMSPLPENGEGFLELE